MRIEQMTLAMLKAVMEREIIEREDNHLVELTNISLENDHTEFGETFTNEEFTGTNHLCQLISCSAIVGDEEMDFTLAWDTVDDKFVVVANDTEHEEWTVELMALKKYVAGDAETSDVMGAFNIMNPKLSDEVEKVLTEVKKGVDAISKKLKGEDRDCEVNRVLVMPHLELQKIRKAMNSYEQTKCDVNRQLSWWVEGRTSIYGVMEELGIVPTKREELENVLHMMKMKLEELESTEGLTPAEIQQKHWAIFEETRHELGYA